MKVKIDDIVAFDDCTLLNQIKIKLPKGLEIIFGNKKELTSKNFKKILELINYLNKNNIQKYRFQSSLTDDQRILKVYKQITNNINLEIYKNASRINIISQIESYKKNLEKNHSIIEKDDNIIEIKKIFQENEKELKKPKNIPEDDDMKIISGYQKFESKGNKFLISEDEHFWGYSDLIQKEFSINAVAEWKCNQIC